MKKLIPFLALYLSAWTACAIQDTSLVIGIKESPPFISLKQSIPTGLSVSFWELVEYDLGRPASYRTYDDISELIAAVENGEVDLSINPITVTDQRMKTIDFSQPFFISGTSMVRMQQNEWLGMLRNIFSWRFTSAIAILLSIILIFGILVWLFERRRNPDQFGKGWRGVADGFWWSAVTMTTVGYGDKAPVSPGGRFIGFIWMFAAIILISTLTAGIASALTVRNLDNRIDSVEDLRNFVVGTIDGSSSEDYLRHFGVQAEEFISVEDGLQAVKEGKIEVFVYDRPILKDYLNRNPKDDLILLQNDLKTDYYSFSYPKGSELRDRLDPIIVKALKSQLWSYRLQQLQKDSN